MAIADWTGESAGAILRGLASEAVERGRRASPSSAAADVMSLCCVNQATGTEYPPYDLTRVADNNWTLNQVTFAPTIASPGAPSGRSSANSSSQGTTVTTGSNAGSSTAILPQTTNHEFVVTAINSADRTESIASPILYVGNALDMAATAASVKMTWPAVAGAASYNICQAMPGHAEATTAWEAACRDLEAARDRAWAAYLPRTRCDPPR